MFGDEPTDQSKAGPGISPGLVVAVVLAAGLVAFVAQNTRKTTVEWLVFEFHQPLWIVLLVTAAVTLVLAELVGAARRRRKRGSR